MAVAVEAVHLLVTSHMHQALPNAQTVIGGGCGNKESQTMAYAI